MGTGPERSDVPVPLCPAPAAILSLGGGLGYTLAMSEFPEKPRRRWFRITPGRCVVALLALEGFLLLSQWLQWFAFNRHAIWSILIAAAAIAATMLLMFFWLLLALIFKWRFQFSIRALLLLTLVVAIACAWFVAAREQARKQREIVEEVRKAGGGVSYDYETDSPGVMIPARSHPDHPGCASCWETTFL